MDIVALVLTNIAIPCSAPYSGYTGVFFGCPVYLGATVAGAGPATGSGPVAEGPPGTWVNAENGCTGVAAVGEVVLGDDNVVSLLLCFPVSVRYITIVSSPLDSAILSVSISFRTKPLRTSPFLTAVCLFPLPADVFGDFLPSHRAPSLIII